MVKDIRYIIKKIIIGVGIALLISALRGQLLLKANAQVLYYRLYDSDYNLMYESDGTYSMNGTISPVRYARVVFDDPLAANNSYSLSTQFGLAAGIDYAWVYWGNNSSGINVGGSYLTQQPTSATTSNQQQTGATTYYKQSNFMFDFVPTSSTTSNWFLQLDFGSGRELRFFDLLNYTLINGGVSNNQDVINQTNNIINNQNINNQNVINNQNENTQNIINNQNQIAEEQNKNQQVCKNITLDKSYVAINNKALNKSGGISDNESYIITRYVDLSDDSTIKVLQNHTTTYQSCFYDKDKVKISCISANEMTVGSFLTIPSGSCYFRASINKNLDKPLFDIYTCQGGNQAITDSLTDDSGISDNELQDLFGDLQESNSPVSDLLTLPITLLQAYLTGFDSVCTTYNLGSLYGTNLTLPCIDIPSYIGNSLWTMIDALCCIYMIYNIAMLFVSIYEQFTSLDDSFQLLYSPRHSGHTRVSRNEGEY